MSLLLLRCWGLCAFASSVCVWSSAVVADSVACVCCRGNNNQKGLYVRGEAVVVTPHLTQSEGSTRRCKLSAVVTQKRDTQHIHNHA